MRRLLLAACCLGTVGTSAQAQYPYSQPLTAPYQRPVVSPYINLLRPGAPPAINYFGVVRPEVQLYNSANLLQQQITANRQAVTGLEEQQAAPLTTGHPIYFLNYQRYFLNFGAAAPGGGSSLRPGAGAAGTAGSMGARPGAAAAGAGARPGPTQPGARGF